jgi:hypothetical protein
MSVGDIFTYALSHMSEDPTDAVWTENRFNWLNTVKDHIVSRGNWRFLEAFGQLTVPASGGVYFPDSVWEVLSIWPSALGYRRPLYQVGALRFDKASAGISAGISDYEIPWGRYGVMADNSVTGTITATSSAAAADNGMQIVVEGLDANRNDQIETITLAGLGTRTTTNNFLGGVDGVRKVYINDSSLVGLTQGIVTIVDAAATQLESLNSALELYHEHLRTELYPITAGSALTYRYYRRVPDFRTVDQVIPMPREFKDIFLWGFLWMAHDKMDGPNRGAYYEQKMNQRMDKLRWYEEKRPGMKRNFRPSRTYRTRGRAAF